MTPADETSEARPVLAALRAVDKRFAGVHAVRSVTLELRAGEVHCLIGENGAGKSTVVKMLAGVHRPDGGRVELGGLEADLRSPHDALRQGVSTVFQELTLVPYMTVAENIGLGQEPVRARGVLDRRRRNENAARLLGDLGIHGIRPRSVVGDLGIAQQQQVEIAKAVSRDGERVVIMDEPTATLTTTETETLFSLIRRLRARGVAILYITHRLEELAIVGDIVSVMRDGAVVHRSAVAEVERGELIEAMVGRRVDDVFVRRDSAIGDLAIEITEGTPGPDGEVRTLRVRRGEVVGLFGLVGSGRTEMVRSVIGADPADHHKLGLNGRPTRLRSPADAVRKGVALVPEDRKGQGIVPRMSVASNIGLSALRGLRRGPLLPSAAMPNLARRYVSSLNIRTPSVQQEIMNLSGGNQQKCLLARVLASDPDVIVLDEPTRGIDVGARVEVYRLINRLCDEGRAVLMITSDLPEAIGMSDRIYAMRAGRLVGELDADRATQDAVMRLALGEGSSTVT